MAELSPLRASVVDCLGSPGALDAVVVERAVACRVAPDELLLVGVDREAELVLEAATAWLSPRDGHSIVLDATDGWAGWTVEGDDAAAAFAHVSMLELPAEGFVQGHVARVPARVLTEPGKVHVLVEAMYGTWLRERLLSRCPELTEAPQAGTP